MGLVNGTNCGFVLSAPVADPGGTSTRRDNYASAIKVVAPVGISAITEIGWWQANSSSADTNFEVGLYSHDASNDKPDTLLEVDDTNAKGTDGGWKTVSVNWLVTPGTTYWIAVQIDYTPTHAWFDYKTTGGLRVSVKTASTLLDTWPGDSNEGADYLYSIYALYTAVSDDILGTIAGASGQSGALTFATTGLVGTITGVATVSGPIVTERSISGTIAGVSTLSGPLSGAVVITGTIVAAATLSSNILLVNILRVATISNRKRLIAVGNNKLYYEDI